jgi:hypothetical protein
MMMLVPIMRSIYNQISTANLAFEVSTPLKRTKKLAKMNKQVSFGIRSLEEKEENNKPSGGIRSDL